MNLPAEQDIDRERKHECAAGDVDSCMLRREKLPQHRCAHGYRQDDRRDPGGEEEGHGDQEAAILERTGEDRKSTRLNSSHTVISYAVFCLKKKTTKQETKR